MGQHRTNPVALANKPPQRQILTMPIGDGYAVAGLTLQPMLDNDGNFCAVLSVVAGRMSDLVPFEPHPMVLGELCKIPLDQLRAKVAEMLGDDLKVATESEGAT